MEQYIHHFITYLKEVKNASPNTIQAYRNDLKKLQIYYDNLNITSIAKISETSLNSYVLSLEKEGLSPSSVSRNIAAMKAFLLYLMKQGVLRGDPSERIKPPKIEKKNPKVIDILLMEQLLKQPQMNSPKGIRDKAMLELLYATGMKVSELLAIKMEDINLKQKYITCGEKRERVIPLGQSALQAIKEYINIRKEEFYKQERDTDYLFLNTNGLQLSRQGFWKILKGYAKKAGIDDIMPNTIRHSFAAHLLENGADLGSVQEFLGHADIHSTNVYLASNQKSRREVYMNTHPRA